MASYDGRAVIPGLLLLLLFFLATLSVSHAQECKTFAELYGDGRTLCNRIFGDSFEYSDDLENAYTMWFFDRDNPNDAVSRARNLSALDSCQIQYFHKTVPGPEPPSFTECHPWRDYSCCREETVESKETLRTSYGPEYYWDRCGPLSQACERFFVQEACFYECDVNAGHFRRYPPGVYNESDPTHNTWELYKLPIRGDYCDAWFEACREDLFCASAGGDFFSCAREYVDQSKNRPSTGSSSKLSSGAIAGITIASIIGAALLAFVIVLVRRERQGRAVFAPLVNDSYSTRTPSFTTGVEMGNVQ